MPGKFGRGFKNMPGRFGRGFKNMPGKFGMWQKICRVGLVAPRVRVLEDI